MKIRFWLVLMAALLLASVAVAEESEQPVVPTVVWSHQTETGAICVRSEALDGEAWLFLPSCAELTALSLTVETQGTAALCWQGSAGQSIPCEAGAAVDWQAIADELEPGVLSAELADAADGASVMRLNVMQSEGLRSVHLYSDDPVNEGREWVESHPWHENVTSATVVMLRPDGSVSANEKVEKLRGRGNSTWAKAVHKKPYQIKLERKTNLLETGVPDEAGKKWVLLSNEAVLTQDADLSMLRNQIALDLSREFGLEETSKCAQVDLYYDECYRGTYLLCEKVEVNPGRLNMTDFEEILEKLASAQGIADLDELPRLESENQYGFEISYTQGVPEPEDVAAGGYLVELERGTLEDGTLSDPAWFKLGDGQVYGIKNPSHAGVRMVTYISELMQQVYVTLRNYGYHPETGEPLENILDIESFTRSMLIQEATQNKDGYMSTSTNFVALPGEYKLYAGPLWDFDLTTEKVEELRDNNVWSTYFYRTTVLQRAAKKLYANELYPIIQNILLGKTQGKYLKPLSQYQSELEASWLMNYHRFFVQGHLSAVSNVSLDAYVDMMRDFWVKQSAWLLTEIESWSEDAVTDSAKITLTAAYCRVERSIRMSLTDQQHTGLRVVSTQSTCVKPATEDDFAIWQAEMVLEGKPNVPVSDALVITVNGEEVPFTRNDDGTISVVCTFTDPSYRPAMLDGVDYGSIFDFDYFSENYPDLLEECGGTKEDALRYFVEMGMDECLIASDYFDPGSIAMGNPAIEERFIDMWRKYYEGFISGKIGGTESFEPELMAWEQ